ncbi:glycine betaine ABC transporter substrate-binding protein [Rhodococcus sp. NPDC003318]|uniref:glycine betaine ABC transporter substrate-binding protein n=1 Tax=Rhodococcus sp. NPDC003318 TaxID=3364503 RepID=UPI00369296C0
MIGSRTAGALAVVTMAAALVGCAPDSSLTAEPAPAAITVGAGQAPDLAVLAEIYAGVLRGTGSPVDTAPGLAQGQDFAALDDGTVTLVPGYTGPLLQRLQPGATVVDPDDVFEELNRSLPQGLSVSDYGMAEQPGAGESDEATEPAANVVPLMRSGVLTTAQVKALNVVAGELTSAELAEMSEAVRRGGLSPGQAAGEWLAQR